MLTHYLRRDVDYVVKDGAVEMVDEFRGRVALDRRWPAGLHTAVEIKEGVVTKQQGHVLGSITMQHLVALYPPCLRHDRHGRFFRRRVADHVSASCRSHSNKPADDPQTIIRIFSFPRGRKNTVLSPKKFTRLICTANRC